ncbi:TetR family transcriptional regulator C-terminal domain-containing protein [Amycolatopsis sp. PS_44_ISF1]|uniref:TetR/AcrR family transcriptional regulator n=1 Tax=Amycolatopsis sp. PS_44_ISF1 TaxID=2974917 RepID=UPI0028DE1E26|nr:TetR family transcriptional regulator C-terminal domain-containing protein [Amycolatopsis sp. PS_44_ISF1]MDT8914474.1 TetR/AcrR family transcriptional regulator [Amycolatopsis sp. PS_44_ISF1]
MADRNPTNPKLTGKGRRTRLRIIEAAAELMAGNGVAGTTIEDVRLAAGVSTSQVYHYFADKRALILAVVDFQSDAVVGGQEPMFTRIDSMAGLRAWRDFLVEHQRQRQCRGGCPIGALGSELAEIDAGARSDLARAFRRWERGIRTGLGNMQARGELRPGADAGNLAMTVLSTLQGALLMTQLERDTKPLEIALDGVLDYVESFTVAVRTEG